MEDSGFAEAAPMQAEQQYEDRGPRIPPAKLSTINEFPTISIFHKPDNKSPSTLLDGKFSKDAAMVFCDRIRSEILKSENSSENKPLKAFTIVGGDLDAHKEVIAWIKQSVEEQSVIKFKDLDESTPDCFKAYAQIVLTGYQLGIPARNLSGALLKRMGFIAKKQLMTWDDVEWFYQTSFPSYLPEDQVNPLREVAATSVFWAWWNARLDSEETPEEMCILDELRQENKQLDDDLHAWCERNEKEVRRKWAEKDQAKKYGGQASTGDGGGWDQPAATSGGGGGWDQPSADGANGGWDAAAPTGTSDWENPAGAVSNGAGGNTWDTADTVNENDAPFAPPNSLASPELGGVKNTNSHAPLPPLSEITNGFGGDWAEEVNGEVTDQGHQYATNQW